MTVEGSGQIIRNPGAASSGGGTGYSEVAQTGLASVTFPLADGEIALVQFYSPDGAVFLDTGSDGILCVFWDSATGHGGGYVRPGAGTVILTAQTSGAAGSYINVAVLALGSYQCSC